MSKESEGGRDDEFDYSQLYYEMIEYCKNIKSANDTETIYTNFQYFVDCCEQFASYFMIWDSYISSFQIEIISLIHNNIYILVQSYKFGFTSQL